MTDFASRPPVDGASEDKQDDIITALATLHADIATTLAALVDGVEGFLATINTNLTKLHASAVHTMVDDVTFDDDPTTYTSSAVDSSPYRQFDLEIDLAVIETPTDIVIRVQFSDDDTTYYNLMNGPFGDLRYENDAGAKTEVLTGRVGGDYMKIYVVATGTGSTHKFTLTVKVTLKK